MSADTARLVKRNKRFYVERDGRPIYSPPDFLRPYLQGRTRLIALVEAMNQGEPDIRAIVRFESACRPK